MRSCSGRSTVPIRVSAALVAVGPYSAVIDDVVASLTFGLTALAASVGR
jgi:hypothetical protein